MKRMLWLVAGILGGFFIGEALLYRYGPKPRVVWRNVRHAECVIYERYSNGAEARLPCPPKEMNHGP